MSENQQTLSATLKQEQQLSARQLQSLELLNLPLLELEEKLVQAMAANPLLEAEPDEEAPPLPEPDRDSGGDDESAYDAQAVDDADEWNDELPIPADRGDAAAAGEQREYLLNSLSCAPTLQEQLESELAVSDAPPRIRELAGILIGGIDDTGYLRTTPADVAMSSGASLEEAERALKLIQSFDPPGVGCRDLAECLKLQLERSGKLTPVLLRLLEHHLEEVARNHLPQLARKLGISLDELNGCLAELRKLTPFPGSALAPEPSGFVVPEVEIVRTGDDYEVRTRRGGAPRLFLAERYLKMLEDPALSATDRAYLREKVTQARELMRALELRRSTIERIAGVIVKTQRDFLDRGVEELHPLTMRQVGETLGLHETTISRAAANKFVETPQGIFPFKFFFSAGFTSEDGGELSNRAVMEKIRDLIGREDPARPLSDEQLARQLKDAGLSVARRTVAKYREAMNLPASNLRRKHGA